MDMILKMLPEYAKQVAAPLGNIDKITVVDTGSNGPNSGANKVTGYATNLMSTLQESLKASSGIDVKDLLESFAGKEILILDRNRAETELVETNLTMAASKESQEK